MTEVGNSSFLSIFEPAAQDLEECRFVCMTTDGKVNYVGTDCTNQHRILGVTARKVRSGGAVEVATHPGDLVIVATRHDAVLKIGDVVVSDSDGKAKKASTKDDTNIILGIMVGPRQSVAQGGARIKILMK